MPSRISERSLGQHRISRFVRSLSPAALAATVALLVGSGAGAAAATGASFILGRANHESTTASLKDSKGTPLALSAPARTAPLAVNRTTMVKNLNAQYLNGFSSSNLASAGGAGSIAPGTDTPLNLGMTAVVKTGSLPGATYYVTATAMVDIQAPDNGAYCWIATTSAESTRLAEGDDSGYDGIFTLAETVAVTVPAGDALEEVCSAGPEAGGPYVYDAGITAVRIVSSG
jgi:hypothetical protein